MLNWSNRGQGSCPQCRSPYSSRSTCSTCGYELGGSTSAKVPKLSCPLAVRVHGHGDLFSTRTSTRDDRCFVLKEGDFWICLHTECKNLRAMYVSSNRPADFTCSHIKSGCLQGSRIRRQRPDFANRTNTAKTTPLVNHFQKSYLKVPATF